GQRRGAGRPDPQGLGSARWLADGCGQTEPLTGELAFLGVQSLAEQARSPEARPGGPSPAELLRSIEQRAFRLRREVGGYWAHRAELVHVQAQAGQQYGPELASLVQRAQEHLAMVRRPFGANPLVRLHSECLTGDALGSLKCDCGQQLQESLRLISDHPDGGAVIYLRDQEGRGIGLANKIRTYALQEQGFDTLDANIELGFPADGRDYAIAAQIVKALGMQSVRLLSNNPHKAQELERYGVTVTHRDPLVIAPNPFNHDYLATKTARFGHTLKRQ
ncbi:MAG: hypothetical protein RIR97_1705, partial [Pseudomonadota bacterium]